MPKPKRILISKNKADEYRVYNRGQYIQIDCWNDNTNELEWTELIPKRLIKRINNAIL